MRRFFDDEGGNVTILAAVSLPALAIAAGFAINYASLLRTQADLQNTADTAALAAGRELGTGGQDSASEREAAAVTAATSFITSRTPDAVFAVSPSASDATVEVSLSTEQALVFGDLFGSPERSVSVEAVSTYMIDQRSGCLIALDQASGVGIAMQGSAKVSAPNCGVWSNAGGSDSIHMQGSPSLQGSEVCAEGASGNAAAKIKPELSTDCGPAADPYGGRLDDVPTACDHTNFAFDKKAKEATLEPGVYCGGLSIDNIEVTLTKGLFVIKDGPLTMKGNGIVSGTEVSVVLTGDDAGLQMQGSTELSLTAMTTGDFAGIALATTNTGKEASESDLQGSPKLTVEGSIYMPGQLFKLQGSPHVIIEGDDSKLVGGSFSFTGSPDVDIGANDTEGQIADVGFLRLLR
jgi:hypothetical protein